IDKTLSVSERNSYSRIFIHQFCWAGVVRNNRGNSESHRFQNHAVAEFFDAWQGEKVTSPQTFLHLSMRNPSMKVYAWSYAKHFCDLFKQRFLRAITNNVHIELSTSDKFSCRFQKHVGPL